MAKLYFYYASMNSGKSAMLLQASFNYRERNMNTLLFISQLVNLDYIYSRIGLKENAISFCEEFNFFDYIKNVILESGQKLNCILIDEAQFLNKKQVFQICEVVDKLNIPVLCYGLRSDFRAEPFEGSKYLLILADKLCELKTMCPCGKKAIMNMKKAKNIKKDDIEEGTLEGDKIDIGGDKYISLCRKCYFKKLYNFKKLHNF